MECKKVAVAIDGPAGAGKSSVAKAVAKKLGYIYIDTGAMYRAVALYMLRQKIDIVNEEQKVALEMANIAIKLRHLEDGQHIYLNGEDVSNLIRTSEVSAGASVVAAIAKVREKLVMQQKKLAESENVIMDGRDIGTTVLPNADVKIFLTASVEERAERRYRELAQKGVYCDLEQIMNDITKRDKNDAEREISPLRQAEDAILIDTSDFTFEESEMKVIEQIKLVVECEEEK